MGNLNILGAKKEPVRLLMVGLDAAGKTTMLYRLKPDVATTIPTIGYALMRHSVASLCLSVLHVAKQSIPSSFAPSHMLGSILTYVGFNVETVEMDGVAVTSWDMGGRCPLRPLWRHYYQSIDGIVMVLDSNDRERLADVSHELNRLLGEEQLSGMPLLVLANKQDLPDAMMCEEIVEGLHLNNLRDRTWLIQSCCATTNEGVQEGLAWIKSQITTKKTVQAAIKPFKETVQDAQKEAITDQLLGAFKSLFVTMRQS